MLSTGRRRFPRLAFLVGAAALLAPGFASSRPGTVFWVTYLRAGPGHQYAVLDELDPHSSVEVQECGGDWCRVVSERAEGYMLASMLSAPDIHGGPPATPHPGECVKVRLNGFRGKDEARVCGE